MKKSIIYLCVLLSGCGKVNISSEFSKVQQTTEELTGSKIVLAHYNEHVAEEEKINQEISLGISRTQAVQIALLNNPTLQAMFEKLGIAKADLVQAGLFTNPKLDGVVRFPTTKCAQTNIEGNASLRISDLWQIPIKKNIAQDVLEVISQKILKYILDIIAQTKIAYDTCLYTELELDNQQKILAITKELKKEIYYRQLFGYTTDLDKDYSNVRLDYEKNMYDQLLKKQEHAFIFLREILGITPSNSTLTLIDNSFQALEVPVIEDLEEFASENRPEIKIQLMKIKRAKDQIKLEKSRMFNDVNLGIAYKHDFEPFQGWGPSLNLDIPLFDTNNAQVARAEFQYKRAEKRLRAQRNLVRKEVKKHYVSFSTLKKRVQRYQCCILPSLKHAKDYAYTYANLMQVNMVTALESKLKVSLAQKKFIKTAYKMYIAFALLERAYGRQLS